MLFFDAVLNHKIEQEKIVLKKDGTTLLKLKLLKYIPLIISKKVTLSNGGTYLNLNFDKAINTKSNKNKLAITLIEDNFKYKPNSLIDRTKINKFPHGNEVTAIKSIDLRTKRGVILYAKFNKIFKI